MLCDISKVHSGFGIIPKVTHTTEDSEWGKVGSSKKVHVANSIFNNGGFASVDRIIERRENEYWQIQVDEFQTWMLGFYKFVGEWQTIEIEEGKIQIDYSYQLHCKIFILYPICWIFGNILWRKYMKQVIENIRIMAYQHETYLYA